MGNLFIEANLISALENHHITSDGVLKDGLITYNEDMVEVSINKDDNVITMIRRHPDYELTLRFSDQEKMRGSYLLKEINKEITVDTMTKKIINNDQKIEIVYDLYLDGTCEGEYQYTLKYEVK